MRHLFCTLILALLVLPSIVQAQYDIEFYGATGQALQGTLDFRDRKTASQLEDAAKEYLRWYSPGADPKKYEQVAVLPVRESMPNIEWWFWNKTAREGLMVKLSTSGRGQSAQRINSIPGNIAALMMIPGQISYVIVMPGGVRTNAAALDKTAAAASAGKIPPEIASSKRNTIVRLFYPAKFAHPVSIHYMHKQTCHSWSVPINSGGQALPGTAVTEPKC